MFTNEAPYAALTRLTHLVQRRPQMRPLLDRALARRLAELAPTALDVAVETGQVLARSIRDGLQWPRKHPRKIRSLTSVGSLLYSRHDA
jgi:hypothetical protein